MDLTFLEGIAAIVAALVVFFGSVFLLLAMVLGARLAYFVTASVTFGVVLIMGVVWSLPAINPLGPVGKLPEWDRVAIAETTSELDFGPAQAYPEGGWRRLNEEDESERTRAGELQNDAADYLEQAIESGEIETFEEADDATADTDSVRLLAQNGAEYGALTFTPVEGGEPGTALAVMKYDPGNLLGPARTITTGTFVLFVGHLFGLARAERKTREERRAIEAAE